jgi:hypothetical protein
MFGVFLVQITSNKAKNQCRKVLVAGLISHFLNTMKKHFCTPRGMKVFRGHRHLIIALVHAAWDWYQNLEGTYAISSKNGRGYKKHVIKPTECYHISSNYRSI